MCLHLLIVINKTIVIITTCMSFSIRTTVNLLLPIPVSVCVCVYIYIYIYAATECQVSDKYETSINVCVIAKSICCVWPSMHHVTPAALSVRATAKYPQRIIEFPLLVSSVSSWTQFRHSGGIPLSANCPQIALDLYALWLTTENFSFNCAVIVF